ncbi:methionine aminopeptidase, type II [Pyrolobus fumarii 1A]|uniref:Methionine aminopeptidase n=1 Tax=Pyrolobus fumarii (strain DSM 11204 / 1A) TaxID=694429 RepID=G0EEB4_PYRF1|nr:type II methionyl aminopeptidase [Pyrolobus fumarii]AEM38808.1 methionine aminopeptidase, type II [Pyrolobus fumarii 1A]
MDEEILRKYLEAGRIARIVLQETVKLVEPGARLLDICDYAERRTRELGGEPAFPCNISVNDVAAHYTPVIGDDATIPEDAIVKIDIGVHVDGYIADTAVTVDLSGKHEKLLEAAREALEAAIREVKPGVSFQTIGAVVERLIKSKGFKPIANLSGHSLGRYLVHAGESIPNVNEPLPGVFRPGNAYAIEPFATTGEGYVVEREPITIYSLNPERPSMRAMRLRQLEKRLLSEIATRFRTLPFTERWFDVEKYGGVEALRLALRKLWRARALIGYPMLVERSGGLVAQFEHTVLVLEDRIIVTTGGDEGEA